MAAEPQILMSSTYGFEYKLRYLLAERPRTHFNALQASVFSSVNWWSQYRIEPYRVIVKTKWDYAFSKYLLNTYCVQDMRLTAGDIVVSKTDPPLPSWIVLSNGINNLTGKSAHSMLAIISSNSTNNLKWDQFALPWIQACFCGLIRGVGGRGAGSASQWSWHFNL